VTDDDDIERNGDKGAIRNLAAEVHRQQAENKALRTQLDRAVADMALALDAHEEAFDEIAKLCGCPEWECPGQVVRDVEKVVKERDEAWAWRRLYFHERRFIELEERLRVSDSVRDAARAASNRNLEEKRKAEAANDHYAALLAAQEKRVSAMDAECQELRKTADDARDGLRELAIRVQVMTKHGPRGSGAAGPCDSGCLKCAAKTAHGTVVYGPEPKPGVSPNLLSTQATVSDEALRLAAVEALKPDSPPSIAYSHVYKVMGNEGTADERGELFWRTLREVRDGTFTPDKEVAADWSENAGQRPSEHPIRLVGYLNRKRVYACACGVVGGFQEMTDENHEAIRIKNAVQKCARCKGTGWGEPVAIDKDLPSCSACNGTGGQS
jgi:hypothetical protein